MSDIFPLTPGLYFICNINTLLIITFCIVFIFYYYAYLLLQRIGVVNLLKSTSLLQRSPYNYDFDKVLTRFIYVLYILISIYNIYLYMSYVRVIYLKYMSIYMSYNGYILVIYIIARHIHFQQTCQCLSSTSWSLLREIKARLGPSLMHLASFHWLCKVTK